MLQLKIVLKKSAHPEHHMIKGAIKNKILNEGNDEKNINKDKAFLEIPFLKDLFIKK